MHIHTESQTLISVGVQTVADSLLRWRSSQQLQQQIRHGISQSIELSPMPPRGHSSHSPPW